jgi:hypothetical protein
MSDSLFVDWDYSLAAVKFKGRWRFFYDLETMFVLDYTAYDDDYSPLPGDYRYGTLIVDENNAEQWMASLERELTPEQLPETYWENTSRRVQLTFVIDFDKKLWAGQNWKMDQSPLESYQPEGWSATYDAPEKYLPPEIRNFWA